MRDRGGHHDSDGPVGPGGRDERRDGPTSDYTEFGFRDPNAVDPLDAVLDGDQDRRSPEFRAAFVRDRGFRNRVHAMDAIIGQLKRGPKPPDLASSILDAVDARKPFLTPRRRRAVSASRVAVAASLLALLGGFAVLDRMNPGVLDATPAPMPVSHAVGRAAAVGGEIRENLSPANFAAAGAVFIQNIVAAQPTVGHVELHMVCRTDAESHASSEPREAFACVLNDEMGSEAGFFGEGISADLAQRPLGNSGTITIGYDGSCETVRPRSCGSAPVASSAVIRPLGSWANNAWTASSVRQSSATWARAEYSLLPYRSDRGSR